MDPTDTTAAPNEAKVPASSQRETLLDERYQKAHQNVLSIAERAGYVACNYDEEIGTSLSMMAAELSRTLTELYHTKSEIE